MYVEKFITKDWILAKVSQEEIFRYYVGDCVDEKRFCSILRKDNNPSCSLYYSKTNILTYKDFATGESLDCFGLVKELFGLNLQEAIKKIASDFGLFKGEYEANIIKANSSKIEHAKKKVLIHFQKKPFTQEDLEYWNSYGITETTLNFFDVHSVKTFWINRTKAPLKKNDLCFVYYFPKTTHCKIYKPLAPKKEKWKSNITNEADIQGYYQMDIKTTKPELLILTSSLKEVMLLHEFGIKAMAIHGENSHFNPKFIEHLRRHCKRIYSLYDIDAAGFASMEKLKQDFGIQPIIMPNFECIDKKIKDLTDSYRYCNKEKVVEFIQSIKNYGHQ